MEREKCSKCEDIQSTILNNGQTCLYVSMYIYIYIYIYIHIYILYALYNNNIIYMICMIYINMKNISEQWLIYQRKC